MVKNSAFNQVKSHNKNNKITKNSKNGKNTKTISHNKNVPLPKLSQCDIDILHYLKNGPTDVLDIHDNLTEYSDQQISLNLSWLEKNNFVKKMIITHLGGSKSITYQLDGLGRNYSSRN